jgi:hypothetical protein
VVAAGCLLRRRRCRRLLTPAERLVLVAIAELVHQDDYRRGSPQTSRTHDELVRVAGLTNAALRKAIYRPANPVVEHADRPPLEVRVPDTAVLLAMGRDQADGRITLRGRNHRLSVTWDTTRNDALYAEEQAFSGELVRRFGGRPFVTPTWRLLRQPVTVHNLGGAPMGTDPATPHHRRARLGSATARGRRTAGGARGHRSSGRGRQGPAVQRCPRNPDPRSDARQRLPP